MADLLFVLTERQFSKLPDATKSAVNTRWAKVVKQYKKILDECNALRAELAISQQQTEKWIGKSLDIGNDLTHVRDTLQIVDRNLQEMTVERNKLAAERANARKDLFDIYERIKSTGAGYSPGPGLWRRCFYCCNEIETNPLNHEPGCLYAEAVAITTLSGIIS